jgi:aryl-alcohol dehydrogenase-like predicted oxidoreductase
MQTRHVGNISEPLSAIGFGCMGLVGWYGVRDDAEARATLLEAVDRGINHFDTAASYQGGENERFVGDALRSRRDQLFIATKFGITRNPDGGLVIDNRPNSIKAACYSSLKRLQISHIDLFYLHRIDRTVEIEDSMDALASLVRAGHIRYVGLSECSAETLRRAHAVHPVAAVQSEYSIWSRDPEGDVLEACRELGVGFVAYSPLGRGFLAGNFRALADLPVDDNRQAQPRFKPGNIEHNRDVVACVERWAERKGCTPAQLALAWVLARGEDIVAIPGTKRRERLAENLGALDVRLQADEMAAIADEVTQIGVRGDRQVGAMMETLKG